MNTFDSTTDEDNRDPFTRWFVLAIVICTGIALIRYLWFR